jgi:hypothetical protein
MPPSTLPSDTEKLQNIGMLLGSIYSSYLEAKELRGSCRKGLSSLLMLAAFEIWNEMNTLVYRSFASIPSIGLSDIMPGK